MPLKAHENILIFYRKLPVYNPQKTTGHKPVNNFVKYEDNGECYGKTKKCINGGGSLTSNPNCSTSHTVIKNCIIFFAVCLN
jgi:site-specific DNA-methyltransferase (adenine-specific)